MINLPCPDRAGGECLVVDIDPASVEPSEAWKVDWWRGDGSVVPVASGLTKASALGTMIAFCTERAVTTFVRSDAPS